ncbi:probable cytochrome P450 9f2 isoform X1 [Topomyia yanbarensis]|uniref:probable cytochrome P450 9f2 isoform X1 n=1 Tax=Topomyia yanbarensis TaxID=2498891 RepID=UPI00273C9113|nr:probable cytochrome P450 9f2 isoform X1 [Topomyia yanbarensis]
MLSIDPFTVAAIAGIVLLIYLLLARNYKFFEKRGIPFVKPTFLFGNTAPVLFKRRDFLQHIQYMYDEFPESKIIGLFDFLKPVMMIRDVDAIKQMGVKDFDHFSDHTPFFTSSDVEDGAGESLFGNSLVLLCGQKWRDMRATLSPAFTGSRMRQMFELVSKCAESTVEFFLSEAKAGQKLEYEMKDVFSRIGNDVIASVAFGIQVDSLRDQENEFYVKGKELLNFKTLKAMLKMVMFRLAPSIPRMLKMDISSPEPTAYFKHMIVDNMKQRDAHGIVRNDMIQMLMQVRKGTLAHQNEEKDTKDAGFATVEESKVGRSTHNRMWTENELVSQCFLFFVAGFDSVSTALTFVCYELLANPDVQQKLYEEIVATDELLRGNSLTYDALQKMQYMDMVVSETLRLWPPAPFSDRVCVKDYLFDDGKGTRVKIDKGQTLWFPITALHHDPQYYPDPYKFDPERFSEANRSQINPTVYLPFGIGPRNCIGSRFALMEVKAVLYNLLKNFTFERTEKSKIPLRLAESIVALQTKDGVWLELVPRDSSID